MRKGCNLSVFEDAQTDRLKLSHFEKRAHSLIFGFLYPKKILCAAKKKVVAGGAGRGDSLC